WRPAFRGRPRRRAYLPAQCLGQQHRRCGSAHRCFQLQARPIREAYVMAHGPAKGIGRWLFTTNHKDIGTLYLWFSFAMFLLGGFFAMVIRAELFQPGMQIIRPEFFNQMTTMHGLVMVFGAIMPAFV